MGDQITQLYNEALRPAIVALTFEVLFYGVYMALSWTYLSLLTRQRSEEKFKHLFYPISTLALFLLATTAIILSTFDLGNLIQLLLVSMGDMDPTAREETFVGTRTAIGAVYTLGNFLGDIILVYRCYHIWNGNWLAIIAPSILSFVNLVISVISLTELQLGSGEEFATGGYSSQVSAGDSLLYGFLGINVFNNILLTALIAGRLWYLNNAAAKLFGIAPSSDKRYTTIISMFLESGSLYPIALIICLVIQVRGSPASMDPILMQIVGIAPMLILVRTSLGISIEHAPRREDVDAELEEAHLPMQTLGMKHASASASPRGRNSVSTTSDFYPNQDSISVSSKYDIGAHEESWNAPLPQSLASAVDSERWNRDLFNPPSTPCSTDTDRLQPLRRE